MAKILRNPQTGDMVRLNEQTGQWEDYYDPTAGIGTVEKMLAGAGKAVADTGRGIGQLFGMVSDQEVADARRRDEPLMDTGAGMAGNVAGHIATALTPGTALKGAGMLPGLGRLSGIGSSMMAPQTVKGAAALGAGYSALQPGSVGERAGNALLGGVGGGAGQAVGKYVATGVDKAITPTRRAISQRGKQLGFKTTPGQETGNPGLLRREASIESTPSTTKFISNIKEHNQSLMNRYAAKAIGQNTDELGPDILAQAHKDIGAKFDAIEAIDQVALNADEVIDGLAQAEAKYTAGPGRRIPPRIKDTIDDILDKAQQGQLTGKEYKVWRSILGRDATKEFTSAQGDRALGEFLADALDVLDDQAQNALPADTIADYALARRQWKNLLDIQASMKPDGTNVSGVKLHNRLFKKDASYKGGNVGDPATKDLHDATWFATTHRDIADSGTAARMYDQNRSMTSMLGGIGTMAATGDPVSGLMGGVATHMALPAAQKLSAGAYMSQPSQALLRQGGLLGQGVPPALIAPIQSGLTLGPVGLINTLKE